MKSTTKETGVATPGKPFLMRVGIGLFALGMLAVLTVFIMFAAGLENLPIWLGYEQRIQLPLEGSYE